MNDVLYTMMLCIFDILSFGLVLLCILDNHLHLYNKDVKQTV